MNQIIILAPFACDQESIKTAILRARQKIDTSASNHVCILFDVFEEIQGELGDLARFISEFAFLECWGVSAHRKSGKMSPVESLIKVIENIPKKEKLKICLCGTDLEKKRMKELLKEVHIFAGLI